MIHVGKQGYVFILTDFKKRCFDVSFLTSICVNNYFDTENFFKYINAIDILFIRLVIFETKQ